MSIPCEALGPHTFPSKEKKIAACDFRRISTCLSIPSKHRPESEQKIAACNFRRVCTCLLIPNKHQTETERRVVTRTV